MIFATFKNTYEVAPEKLKPTIHLFQPSKLTFQNKNFKQLGDRKPTIQKLMHLDQPCN